MFDIYLKSLCFHILRQMENYSKVQNKKKKTSKHREHTQENFFLNILQFLPAYTGMMERDRNIYLNSLFFL